MGTNLHVSRDWQLVKCQPALRLYGPSGPYAIKDERVRDGRLLETLCATPCKVQKEKEIKREQKET